MTYVTARYGMILAAFLLATPVSGQPAGGPQPIAETENFKAFCNKTGECRAKGSPQGPAQVHRALTFLEDARPWLSGLGFPVHKSHLESSEVDGKHLIRIDPRSAKRGRCSEGSVACHRVMPGHWSRIFLPVASLGKINENPDTLAHEYLHSIQPEARPQELRWLHEAVATAVGSAFGFRYGKPPGDYPADYFYPPIYFMSLDKPFYDLVDPGYGNWAYLLHVGEVIGSEERVAYLAAPPFLDAIEEYKGESAWAGMRPFYDADLVGTATFDEAFPRFVALFNNIEDSAEVDDSAHLYYTEIERDDFRIASTAEPVVNVYTGTVQTYAVAPILMSLDVKPQSAVEPRDTLMMVDIELVTGSPLDTLSLVMEHKRADERHAETLMLDGSTAPEELGFLRIVNAPGDPSGEAEANAFELRVSARPIGFHPPACFQAGEPAELETAGFAPEDGKNWRLTTDNGSVDGVTVTPARPGAMTLEVEIDSPITRPESGLTPREPAKSRVELGQFDVISDDCMVRLRTGEATLTYTADGSYTEFRGPGGQALYFSAADMAAHEGGSWMPIPPIGKEMLLRRLASRNPAMKALGVGGEGELFFARMPLAFSERFSRGNLRKAVGPAGGPPERRSAACPDGTSGCTETTFLMDGHRVPVVHDAQGRPLTVTFRGEAMEFDYGTWPIRRPPGW